MGGSGDGGSVGCHPNLTPLLDLVLQLVMFFMITANFVVDQMDESIKLPESQAAQPLDSKIDDFLVININENGHLTRGKGDSRPQIGLAAITNFFANEAKVADKDNEGNVKKLLIIRAHKDSTFEQVFLVLKAAKAAGFKAVQLRAIKR